MIMYELGNFIAQIKGAAKGKLEVVFTSNTNLTQRACSLLYDLGFILGYTILDYKILVRLKYYKNRSVIRKLSLISRPSSRIYVTKRMLTSKRQFKSYMRGSINFVVMSSSRRRDLLVDVEAIMLNTGGEALFVVG